MEQIQQQSRSSHTRIGDSSTPHFIFNGDTLYLTSLSYLAGNVGEGFGISTSSIQHIIC